jgi:hypothetical protein
MGGDTEDRVVHRRAVEAAIWGMPAVSMAALRRSLGRDLGVDYGDVLYFSDVLVPRHELLTANNQTPYVCTVFDLRRGPMVLDVPAATEQVALFGSGIDSWQVPLVDVGPAGEDAGRGGRYVCAGPDFDGEVDDGFILVRSATWFVHFGLRPIVRAAGTLADAVAYSRAIRTYPLAAADDPAPSHYVDGYPHAWRTLPTFDLDFLRLLAEAVDIEPAQPKDAAMLGMLASIGIEKGKPFDPSPEHAELLTRAVVDAQAEMDDYMINQASVPVWPGRQWRASKPVERYGYSFYGDGKLDVDNRSGGFAYYATWAPKRLAEPGKVPASIYFKCFADQAEEAFKGDRQYRLRVPADTPARDFWSIVAYDRETNAFIHNPDERVGVSSLDKHALAVNDDGSVDVHIGPEAPDGLHSNWLPTAGRDFWLIARFYGPQPALLDRTWTFNDVEPVSQ